ncbi:MAG: hypothetical protein NUV67_01690 [archaeon]|nr:hypothetical protein [archaeon]
MAKKRAVLENQVPLRPAMAKDLLGGSYAQTPDGVIWKRVFTGWERLRAGSDEHKDVLKKAGEK